MNTNPRFNHDQDRVDEQASSWIVLVEARSLTCDEQQAFDAWLAADPGHSRTYDAMHRTWAEIPSLSGLAALVSPAPAETALDLDLRKRRFGRFSAAALATVAAAVIALLGVPGLRTSPETDYATEIAQTRLLTLPDGSQVTLAPRSRLGVKFTQGERRVVLTGGEAFFEVTHNAARPFLVEVGSSVIRVVGTKFDVNRGAGSVRVSVLEGVVQVSTPNNAAAVPAQYLRAGERAEIVIRASVVATAAVPVAAVAALPAQAPGAWREGRLVFENARLADLVADVNRYYEPGATLDDAAAGEVRVTAAFKASEIPAFLAALGGVVPVTTSRGADGKYRLKSAANE